MFALPSNFMCVCVSESEINDKLFEVGHVISVVVRRVDHEVFKRFSRLVLWETSHVVFSRGCCADTDLSSLVAVFPFVCCSRTCVE